MKNYSRREWLTTASSLALASAAQADTSARSLMGFGTYGLPGYSLEKSITLIAETGFDSIEIAAMPGYHGAPDQISKPQRTELRKQISDSGLKLGALMGLPTPNSEKQSENTEWVEQMLELANDLAPDSPPMIQSVLGGGQWEEKKNLFRDTLGPWVVLAANSGVKLSIKPHRGHAMSRPEEAIWLIEQLNAKDKLTMVYDYSHYAFRDLPINQTIATALPHTGYLVMKDAFQKDGKVRFALPGETGNMPHATILKKFHAGGYRGEVCCEISSYVWKQEGYNPKTATETCYTNLKKIFSDSENLV